MKVVDFNGREHPWPPTGYIVNFDDRRQRSEPHLRCRTLLRLLYPTQIFLEEVPLPGSTKLRADFVLPWRNLVVEVHGEQHYTFNPYFHGNKLNFLASKARDLKKIDWCNMNNIGVVELPHYESDEQWRERIERGA
jgi:hypothetical protein